jgi:hypothetical protein
MDSENQDAKVVSIFRSCECQFCHRSYDRCVADECDERAIAKIMLKDRADPVCCCGHPTSKHAGIRRCHYHFASDGRACPCDYFVPLYDE